MCEDKDGKAADVVTSEQRVSKLSALPVCACHGPGQPAQNIARPCPSQCRDCAAARLHPRRLRSRSRLGQAGPRALSCGIDLTHTLTHPDEAPTVTSSLGGTHRSSTKYLCSLEATTGRVIDNACTALRGGLTVFAAAKFPLPSRRSLHPRRHDTQHAMGKKFRVSSGPVAVSDELTKVPLVRVRRARADAEALAEAAAVRRSRAAGATTASSTRRTKSSRSTTTRSCSCRRRSGSSTGTRSSASCPTASASAAPRGSSQTPPAPCKPLG